MPNRFARNVPVSDYNPRPLLPEGLSTVARPDGSDELQLAAASGKLASTFGAIADEAAVAEGTAAGKKAGLAPDFRPSGDNLTLRGKAFNEAAIKTYANNLDANLRTDMQSAFEANKNDPAALKKAFDELQQTYETQHVFDDIRGDFRSSFTRLRMPYQNRALQNLEADQHDQGKASLIGNISASQTNAARAAAADPDGPATGAVVRAELGRMDRLIDDAVANESITAAAGAQLKIKNRDDALTSAAVAKAEALKTPEAIEAYRANVKQTFAKGEFNGLSADGYAALDARLEALHRSRRTGINQDESLLQRNINDYVQRAVDGFNVSPDEWTRFAASDAARTEKGKAILELGQAKLTIANLLRNRSVEDGERLVSTMRAGLGEAGVSSGQAEVVKFADQYVKNQRTALTADQLGLAEQKRIVPQVAPLDFQGFAASTDPAAGAALAAQVRARAAQAHAVGAELQRAPQFLRPEEKDRLKDIVAQGGAKALELAGAIVRGADSDAPNILREISPDAPLLAQAGAIIAGGGSLSAARDAFEAAQLKAATGKELPNLPAADRTSAAGDAFGQAFILQGADAGRIRLTADAIAAARLARGNIDPKGSDARTIYGQALQEAAGAQFVGGVQYGGVGSYKSGWLSSTKVVVPAGVRADAFRDVIRAITDADLTALAVPPVAADGKPYSARDLAASVPVWVRGGYRFAQGDPNSADPKYLRGADGRPFVLPFDELADRLRPRASGAFLGGR